MRRTRGSFAACALACLLTTSAAEAENSAASAAAEKLFREGKSLAAAGNYDDAIEKFRASQELEPSVGVLLSIGDAHRARGRVASAWSAYVSARDLAKTKSDPRVADAAQRAADVAPRLPRLTIRVATPGDVTVTDNGLTLPAASLGSSLPVDPGSHAIVATAKGRRPFRTNETLAEGESRDVLVPELEMDEQAATPAADDTRGETRRKIGTGLLVGGAVTTVGGLVFGGLAVAKWSSVTSACPGKQCTTLAERNAEVEEANTAQTLATVSTITVAVGVLAMGAGLVLHLTAPSKPLALTTTFGARNVAIGGTFP